MNARWILLLLPVPFVVLALNCDQGDPRFTLLNVSYDATRELYRKVNQRFVADYQAKTGVKVQIRQSHGGSASQARTVIDGSPADLVTLAMWQDTDAIRKKGMIHDGWEQRLPEGTFPYYSTIVFVVRKGNPLGIHTWEDLLKDGVEIITANPKTGGGAKLVLLAAWGAFRRDHPEATEEDAKAFVARLYRKVPVLDSGARGATITFTRRGIGQVHLTWESEALLELAELPDALEVIYPPRSIRAEPNLAIIDTNVDRKGTRALAEEYVQYLYGPTAQKIIAEQHFRSDTKAGAEYQSRFKSIPDLFRIHDILPGGWDEAQQRFFADGQLFDQIYAAGQ